MIAGSPMLIGQLDQADLAGADRFDRARVVPVEEEPSGMVQLDRGDTSARVALCPGSPGGRSSYSPNPSDRAPATSKAHRLLVEASPAWLAPDQVKPYAAIDRVIGREEKPPAGALGSAREVPLRRRRIRPRAERATASPAARRR